MEREGGESETAATASCRVLCSALTVLAVVGDLHFALLRAQQCLGHLGHRMPVGELAVQEVTSARLLHDVRPGEARHLTEAVITVDNSAVLHAGIGYDEFLICGGGRQGGMLICTEVHLDINTLKHKYMNRNLKNTPQKYKYV